MDIRINGKTLILGALLATTYTFAEYVSTINGEYTSALLSSPSADAPYIIESSKTANGGYVKWSNGYIKQWGKSAEGSGLIFPQPFSDQSTVSVVANIGAMGAAANSVSVSVKSTTTFSLYYNGSSKNVYWQASGF
jgi:hypothetical protein